MDSPVGELWRVLAESYGADTLTRAYGDTPPETWRQAVQTLTKYELQRGMTRMLRGGKVHLPKLPEFMRMCREPGSADDPPPTYRRLPPPPGGWRGDGWDTLAGGHMLAYVLKRATAGKGVLTVEQCNALVTGKNNWAELMRTAAQSDALPKDAGRQWWDECMAEAEQQLEKPKTESANESW